MTDITSLHNPKLKAAAKLRDHRTRIREARFLIDGRREIQRALMGGFQIEMAFLKHEQDDPEILDLAEQLQGSGTELYFVAAGPFQKLAFGDRDEGIVAVAYTPQVTLNSLTLPANPLVAVLEGIEKPGNVGAVLRTADAAGVSAVIVADGGTDLFNPNIIRASLGTLFTLPVCSATSRETLTWLRERGLGIFAARVDGATDYAAASFRTPTALVLGSEAHGVSPVWRTAEVAAVSLPMQGAADSLNVSVTAAVLFYEANRQRRQGVQ